jgi:hypothetical protein
MIPFGLTEVPLTWRALVTRPVKEAILVFRAGSPHSPSER